MQSFYQGKFLGTAPVEGRRERKQNWAEGDASCNGVLVQALGGPAGVWSWDGLQAGAAGLAYILLSISHCECELPMEESDLGWDKLSATSNSHIKGPLGLLLASTPSTWGTSYFYS